GAELRLRPALPAGRRARRPGSYRAWMSDFEPRRHEPPGGRSIQRPQLSFWSRRANHAIFPSLIECKQECLEMINVAVIGTGYWGINLVRTFGALPGCRLRWLCDLDKARLEEVAGQYAAEKATPQIEDIWADPAVDAV